MAPIKIYILAGQSNMVGMGSVKHLHQLIDNKEHGTTTPNEYRTNLWNENTNSFWVRDNVYIKNEETVGKLTVAPGYAAKNCFGPELMFGWTIADAFDDADNDDHESPIILLIKTAWGGKSLSVDFRPPSSGMPPLDKHQQPEEGQVGLFYRKMIQELDGFVWFQGWNDMLTWPTVNEYETNLANLVRDVRHDLHVPSLPFVIGELGQHGPSELMDPSKRWTPRVLAFRKHQYDVTQQKEFRGNTIFVKTAEYMVFGEETFNQPFHYNGRADTFFHIGQALGRGMLKLIQDSVSSPGQCAKPDQLEIAALADDAAQLSLASE
ncbi:hypothetical protein MPSEU_000072500 [Mayamaea pseudoterrestris]|nr:hypothetical protein MPSEU_000072500 [Mayamaea pseudoterrestris]